VVFLFDFNFVVSVVCFYQQRLMFFIVVVDVVFLSVVTVD
jgi:hypothetical protein